MIAGEWRVETVSAYDLKPGDVIVDNGGVFEVVRCTRFPYAGADGGEAQANICRYLGDAPGETCSIPLSWRDGWNRQGAVTARVTRVVR